ncbi:MAG: DUF1028 domain-containing protein [Chloroflexota bacterium]
MRFHYTELCTTYSIVARDPNTGYLGGAVQTHQMGVGRLIPIMVPGVGVIASQSLVNQSYNPMALEMLQQGIAPKDIITALTASDAGASRRQVAVLDNTGAVTAFSGDGCIREFGHHEGDGYSVQANMMTNTTVIDAMRDAYENSTGDLAQRMLASLQAAQAEDGDIRGSQSAALKVVQGERTGRAWESVYDLRVYEHATPVDELALLVTIRRAQLVDQDGHRLLAEGKLEQALDTWREARRITPEQVEPAFWQAVTIADSKPSDDAVAIAAGIFNTVMTGHPRRAEWLDLIGRLGENGLIARDGAADELLSAIEENERGTA